MQLMNDESPRTSESAETLSPALDSRRVNRIFLRLAAIYSQKWTSQVSDPELLGVVRAEWASALAGMADWQLGHGLDACRARLSWPPTIAEYVRLCLDLPTLDECISHLMNNSAPDAVTEMIATLIGRNSLAQLDQRALAGRARGLYSSVYDTAVRVLTGRKSPWRPLKRLVDPTAEAPAPLTDADRASNRRGAKRLKAALGKQATPKAAPPSK